MKHAYGFVFVMAALLGLGSPARAENVVVQPAASNATQSSAAQPQEIKEITFDSGGIVSAADPEDYLLKMRKLIERYDNTVMRIVMPGGGVTNDANDIQAGAAETQKLADDIRAVKPPAEIASQHEQLAASLGQVLSFVNEGGAGALGLPKALGLAAQIQTTVAAYHNAVVSMMSKHGIPSSKDPFAGESESDKHRAMQGMKDLQNLHSLGAGPATGASAGTGAADLNSWLQGLNGNGAMQSGNIGGLLNGLAGGGIAGSATPGANSVLQGLGRGALGGGSGAPGAGSGVPGAAAGALGAAAGALGAGGGGAGADAGNRGTGASLTDSIPGLGTLLQQLGGAAAAGGNIDSLLQQYGIHE